MTQAAVNGTTSAPPHSYDSDSPESAGASADERISDGAGADGRADEFRDSAESAGMSGDEEADDGGQARVEPSREQGGSGAAAGQVRLVRKRKMPAGSVAATEADDDTAFTDDEEAPLMSPEGVAAATAGLDEPSSEDDDDDEQDRGGGGGTRGQGARGGVLAEAGDSGEDSDAEDDGARTRTLRRTLHLSVAPDQPSVLTWQARIVYRP